MSDLTKVEIKEVDGDWQWLGKLTPEMLRLLCSIASTLSDNSVEQQDV